MKAKILLAFTFLFTTSAFALHHCLEQASVNYSKMGHDESMIECLKTDIPYLSVSECVHFAGQTKTSVGKNALLKRCLDAQGRQGHFKNCVKLAEMISTVDQDLAKLFCIDQKYSYTTSMECLEVAKTINHSEIKSRSKELCLK